MKTLQEILSDRESTAEVTLARYSLPVSDNGKILPIYSLGLAPQVILSQLDAATDPWGIKVERVEVISL